MEPLHIQRMTPFYEGLLPVIPPKKAIALAVARVAA